tara:strand:+ start:1712 stop:2314 length:603 start_codon:yes stop_codon:yes gene_type:complete
MRNICLIGILFVSLVSCGTYQYSSNGRQFKSILAITEAGDTVSVPYKDFVRERYDFYPRYQWNNSWYWNNWMYDRWGYNQWWYWNNNWRINTYVVPRSTPVRPKVNPRPRQSVRERIRVNQGRRNETNTTNPRSTQQTESRYNGRRSGIREVVPSQSTRPRISTPNQPRQIRRESRQQSIQQAVGRNINGGRRSSGNIKQ